MGSGAEQPDDTTPLVLALARRRATRVNFDVYWGRRVSGICSGRLPSCNICA